MIKLMRPSLWTGVNVFGLCLAATGMLLQIAAGSDLYPSPTGAIVLIATAVVVVLRPASWTRWLGIGVPLVLGIGAVVAATMTGTFVEQLTASGGAALMLGSWMHVIGLVGAIIGGILDAADPERASTVER